MNNQVPRESTSPQPPQAAESFEARAPLKIRIINLTAVILPFAGLIAAIALLWGPAFSWLYLAILVGMYLITALGITVGYHRFYTHRSFNSPRFVAVILAAMGSMAVEGPVLQWVATHRKHHIHSDKDGDPHSPNTHEDSIRGTIKGMWHAHVGWVFESRAYASLRGRFSYAPDMLTRYAKDLEQDRICRWMSLTFPIWVLLGLLLPALIAGLITMSWSGALLGFLWGGLVRVFLVHHVTWSINSVCHLWGTRPFRSHDRSRNNPILGVLALGEGWHNNHHAFPASARHGLRWWEIDVSFMVIWLMSKVGLASEIRAPSRERIRSKLANTPS